MTNQTDQVAPDRLPVLLVLTSTYPRWRGDPEPGFVHELAKRLTDRFQVTVLGPHAAGAKRNETLDGVEVVRYRYAPERWETLVNDGGIVTNLRNSPWKILLVPGFVFAQTYTAWRLCQRLAPDVIHAHWLLPQGIVAALLNSLFGRHLPFVVTSHGADLYALKGRMFDGLRRYVARRASYLTFVSKAMQKEFLRVGPGLAHCKVLPMGVDLARRFTPAGGERSKNEILFVGRLVEKKGLHILVEAMPRILKERPETRLMVVGFGPERKRLSDQIRKLGVHHSVEFLGAIPQENLPQLYRRAALFVAPFLEAAGGDREGLGLVTIEAIACGCPIVVGDLPAVRDIFDCSEGGLMLVPPGNVEALANAILRSLSTPIEGLNETVRLRTRLVNRFDWQVVAQAYGEVLSRAGGIE